MGNSLALAGAAATGKTTAARIISGLVPGVRYVEVEARECWPIRSPAEREECFMESFLESITSKGPIVHDNALLSVYGYSRALEALADPGEAAKLRDVAKRALRAQEELLSKATRLVLLVASEHAIATRVLSRMSWEEERSNNSVEALVSIHVQAQEFMKDAALKLGVPIVDTTSIEPPQVAILLLKYWEKDKL